MKNSLKIVAGFALLSILFMGCPYSSSVPVDQPTIKVDEYLLGRWENPKDESYYWKVGKYDTYNYKLQEIKKETGEVSSTYIGYFSDVSGSRFMNVVQLYSDGSKSSSYYIYRVNVNSSGSKAQFSEMTDNVTEKFESSYELKSFIKQYMGLSFFWDKDGEKTYYRAD